MHYEDLILETEQTLRSICGFLGEPYHESLLQHHLTAQQKMPAESMQWHGDSVKLPDPSKVFAWKRRMSLADRIIFENVAGAELEMFGYSTENHPQTLGSRLKTLYYTTIKRW